MVYDKNNIEKQTGELLERHGLKSYPLQVVELANRMNIDVYQQFFDDNISGFIEQTGNSAIIHVNKLHSPNRKRFTIAHEIGHFVLHLLGNNNDNDAFDTEELVHERVLFRDNAENEREQQANLFAASLLMNKDLLNQAIEKNGIRIGLLSELFEVSTTAMRFRLMNLDLV